MKNELRRLMDIGFEPYIASLQLANRNNATEVLEALFELTGDATACRLVRNAMRD
jgi:hypothetical protein